MDSEGRHHSGRGLHAPHVLNAKNLAKQIVVAIVVKRRHGIRGAKPCINSRIWWICFIRERAVLGEGNVATKQRDLVEQSVLRQVPLCAGIWM